MRLGELRAVVREAERGELRDQRWKSINRDPRLWELRLKWPESGAGKILIRAYFIEPDAHPDKAVVMLVHRKDTALGGVEKVNQAQDEFIDKASCRLEKGRHVQWGAGWTQPIFPTAEQL